MPRQFPYGPRPVAANAQMNSTDGRASTAQPLTLRPQVNALAGYCVRLKPNGPHAGLVGPGGSGCAVSGLLCTPADGLTARADGL
jgi:hypothetical protein